MKTILTILLLSITVTAFGNTHPDSLPSKIVYKSAILTEQHTNGLLMIACGLAITGLGIVKEQTRTPYPTHAAEINPSPNAPIVLNYMIIGSGLALTGYGVKILIKF